MGGAGGELVLPQFLLHIAVTASQNVWEKQKNILLVLGTLILQSP